MEHVVHAGPGTAVVAKVAGMVHDAERLAAQAQFGNAVAQACLELRGPRSWWTVVILGGCWEQHRYHDSGWHHGPDDR